MASTMLLLRRIKTAQNVSKTTRAMQMIAASKLKRAQDATLASRPYVTKLSAVTKSITQRIDKQSLPAYMKEPQADKKLLIVIAPDKGLCGGLIANLAREVLRRDTKQDTFITVGKKIESTVTHVGHDYIASFPFGNILPSFDVVYPIAKLINEHFLSGNVKSVEIISSHFENIFTQKPHVTKLLPVKAPVSDEKETKTVNRFQLFEPDIESLLPELLNRYLEMAIYQEILESYLSEQAARMLSMQNATNNAKDIIEDLKLEYNKQRQAKITSELLDITGSATA